MIQHGQQQINMIRRSDCLPIEQIPKTKIKIKEDAQTSNVILFKDSDQQNQMVSDENLITPWFSQSTKKIVDPLLRMHNQMIDLVNYLQPNEQEHKIRLQAFQYVKTLIESKIPDVKVESFGSFATKTYLPNSDIDMTVVKEDCNEKNLLDEIYDILDRQHQQFGQITKIQSAKVPIIKFIKTKEKLHMDISINKMDGFIQLKEVQNSIAIFPELKYLLFINKCMLKQRQLSQTYSGGVGSFLLFCMILCFVREIRKDRKNYSLGQFMLKYLQFYGIPNWGQKRIFMRTGQIVNRPPDNLFSLMSPQDDNHDIGAQAFKIKDVFNVYRNRYKLITNYNFKRGESILKYLVNPNNQIFTFIKEQK